VVSLNPEHDAGVNPAASATQSQQKAA